MSAGATPTPPATRIEPVVDVMHGQAISDPYRWLEEDTSPETRAWVAAQNAYTQAMLGALPDRAAIRTRLEAFLEIGTITPPVPRGERRFFTRREGRENQPRLLLRQGEQERVLLDPGRESAAGTVALDWWYPSPDGSLLAYGYSDHGDEDSTLFVLDVDAGAPLADRIPRTRHCSVAWLPDGTGFYYTRYPAAGEVPSGEEFYHRKVFFHALGSDGERDPLVFGEGLEAVASPQLRLSHDGRWLAVFVNYGWARIDVYLQDRAEPERGFVTVAENLGARFQGEFFRDQLYLLTNLDAPRQRVVAVDPQQPERAHWREVLAEPDEATIDDVRILGGRLVVQLLERATARVAVHDIDGRPVHEIALPDLGSITGLYGEADGDAGFIGFESFTIPPMVLEHNVASGTTSEWAAVAAPVDLSSYHTEQVWYRSADGTPISMFVVAKDGTPRDGRQPTLLTGYGGFNISRTPAFNRPAAAFWLEAGGVFALPNLRGGGEYGEAWHRAGMLEQKQHVFDDFLGAAEWLIAEGYTSPDHLAILGGSNGGLLVGAAVTQRPDLFRAVVCSVPLLDMLRFHHFLIARLWVAEYGSADDPAQFDFIHAYSPYHHVEAGTAYPAILLTASESDTRVAPLHARKMAAKLQAASSSGQPVLLRIESEAGHGIGKPLAKQLDEQTDTWSFLMWQLGMRVG
jgi:prolyl oligopeptidase